MKTLIHQQLADYQANIFNYNLKAAEWDACDDNRANLENDNVSLNA